MITPYEMAPLHPTHTCHTRLAIRDHGLKATDQDACSVQRVTRRIGQKPNAVAYVPDYARWTVAGGDGKGPTQRVYNQSMPLGNTTSTNCQ